MVKTFTPAAAYNLILPAHTTFMKKLWLINFLKCGITGWCLEILFTSAESIMLHDWRLVGKTSLLMFPIYGLAAFLPWIGRMVDRWLDKDFWPSEDIHGADLILRHGILYMVLIFIGEYFFGLVLRRLGICPWDYTGRPTNIRGLIRLDFAPLWFCAGLIFERITKNHRKSEPMIL